MVQLALLAVFGLSSQAPLPDVDVWYYPYVEVTGHSAFDHTPPGKYDARDVFGGDYGSVSGAHRRVIFEDDSGGPGQPDFIEWNTKEPVAIDRLVISWQDDVPARDWRNLAHFWVKGRRAGDGPWTILWQQNTPSHVGKYTLEKVVSGEGYQSFRAEFLRGSASDLASDGPSICSLEAYGHFIHQ